MGEELSLLTGKNAIFPFDRAVNAKNPTPIGKRHLRLTLKLGESQTSLTREVEINRTETEGEFLCIATYLPIRNWQNVLPFLSLSRKVQKQLGKTTGVIRYGVKADFFHKKFWTFTVWSDRSYIEPFVRKNPHAEAISRFKDWAGIGAAFVEWTSKDGAIDWNLAYEKLQKPTFYYENTKI